MFDSFIPYVHIGTKLKKIVGRVLNPDLPTNNFSSPVCRQVGLPLGFISNTMLTSTIDIW